MTGQLDFALPPALEAAEPPEARGLPRDGVRLLVGRRSSGAISHHHFSDLPDLLGPGDVLVVNTSATLPAAVPAADGPLWVHFSTELSDGVWLVELRTAGDAPRLTEVMAPADGNTVRIDKANQPYPHGQVGQRISLPGGAWLRLRQPYTRGRLWVAAVHPGPAGSVAGMLERHGRPIRYGYVPQPWPIGYYQTVFGTRPGSAEMPSAGRPFTDSLVTRLVAAGVLVVPILLHTGVASPEAHERPYPERFEVSAATAGVLASAKAAGGRIVAVGTTVVRAVESAVDEAGRPTAAAGWTELVVTPNRGARVVDGLLTGFHEPRASHLDLLAAIAGLPLLRRCYAAALAQGYLWHEFGDVNLLLP